MTDRNKKLLEEADYAFFKSVKKLFEINNNIFLDILKDELIVEETKDGEDTAVVIRCLRKGIKANAGIIKALNARIEVARLYNVNN